MLLVNYYHISSPRLTWLLLSTKNNDEYGSLSCRRLVVVKSIEYLFFVKHFIDAELGVQLHLALGLLLVERRQDVQKLAQQLEAGAIHA